MAPFIFGQRGYAAETVTQRNQIYAPEAVRVSLSNLRVHWNISSHGRTAVAVGVVRGGGVVVSVAPASASFLFVWWGFAGVPI